MSLLRNQQTFSGKSAISQITDVKIKGSFTHFDFHTSEQFTVQVQAAFHMPTFNISTVKSVHYSFTACRWCFRFVARGNSVKFTHEYVKLPSTAGYQIYGWCKFPVCRPQTSCSGSCAFCWFETEDKFGISEVETDIVLWGRAQMASLTITPSDVWRVLCVVKTSGKMTTACQLARQD